MPQTRRLHRGRSRSPSSAAGSRGPGVGCAAPSEPEGGSVPGLSGTISPVLLRPGVCLSSCGLSYVCLSRSSPSYTDTVLFAGPLSGTHLEQPNTRATTCPQMRPHQSAGSGLSVSWAQVPSQHAAEPGLGRGEPAALWVPQPHPRPRTAAPRSPSSDAPWPSRACRCGSPVLGFLRPGQAPPPLLCRPWGSFFKKNPNLNFT